MTGCSCTCRRVKSEINTESLKRLFGSTYRARALSVEKPGSSF